MKYIRTIIVLALFSGSFFALGAQSEKSSAPVHSVPDTVVDFWGEQYLFIRHDSIPMLLVDSVIDFHGNKIVARDLQGISKYYYALTPTCPMGVIRDWDALEKSRNGEMPQYFKIGGGLVPVGINYVAIIDGEQVVIDSHEKFRELFAPVETVQEAIAFAYFFTDSEPIYNLDFLVTPAPSEPEETRAPFWVIGQDTLWNPVPVPPPLDVWYVCTPEIISSYAVQLEDGYELLLYHYKVFGCSHPYIRRRVKVAFDGKVEILEERDAFGLYEENGLCVD